MSVAFVFVFVFMFAFVGPQLFRKKTLLFAAVLAILLAKNSGEMGCGTGTICCVSTASAKTTTVNYNNNNNKARALVRAAQDQARHRVHPRNTDIYQSSSRRRRRLGRILQETTNTTTPVAPVETKTGCSLCAGIDLIPDEVPPDLDDLLEASLYDHSLSESITTAFGSNSNNINDTTTITHTITITNASTCAEIDLYFQHANNNCSFGTSNSSSEEALQKFFFKYCCEAFIPVYQCEKNIHDHILNDDYDTAIPPVVRRDTPISVGVKLVYLFLESIEEEKGSASVVFNITMEWNDPRLTWEVNRDTCTDFTTVHVGQDVETTSIWIPSFNLLNRIQGIEALPPNKALINSKGNITLNFDGKMEAFCNYKGLANIPYDTLGCQFLFGITERSHDYDVYYLDPDVIEFASFGLEAAYNEWQPIPELASKAQLPMTPVVYYNMYFKRAKGHYVSNIIIPTIILTFLSFFTYLLDVRIGERLGFGMALCLVVVAQQIVTAELIVISNERLWIDKLVGWSFYWVLFTMIESAVIGFFYYIREDRVAKRENTRLSMTSVTARIAMMKETSSSNDGDNNDREGGHERLPLKDDGNENATMNGEIAEEERERERMGKVAIHKPPRTIESGGNNGEEQEEKYSSRTCKWLKTVSLRKVDYGCLVFSILTYTAFLAAMFITVEHTKFWIAQDPFWYDSNFNQTPRFNQYHVNQDPANWLGE